LVVAKLLVQQKAKRSIDTGYYEQGNSENGPSGAENAEETPENTKDPSG
jgi:hypothetical protein